MSEFKPVEEFDLWLSAMKRIGVSEDTHYHPLLRIARRLRDDLERANTRPDLKAELVEAIESIAVKTNSTMGTGVEPVSYIEKRKVLEAINTRMGDTEREIRMSNTTRLIWEFATSLLDKLPIYERLAACQWLIDRLSKYMDEAE